VTVPVVEAEIRRRRYLPIPDQGRWLAAVVRGHQAYYAVPGNNDAMSAFRHQATPAVAMIDPLSAQPVRNNGGSWTTLSW
jgi:hypothetical protein